MRVAMVVAGTVVELMCAISLCAMLLVALNAACLLLAVVVLLTLNTPQRPRPTSSATYGVRWRCSWHQKDFA